MIDPKKVRLTLAIALIVVAMVFFFFRLGHYSLWDDEAIVALSAKGVLASGDTTAILDNNIVAYRHGALLKNWHDRSTPPLPAYLTAASFALFGENTFAARLPFALCGLLWTLLLVRWLWKENVGGMAWTLFLLGCIGNVSLFLFFRQCRYYALTILCSTAITYLYLNWNGQTRQKLWIILLSLALFASNYMNYFALYGCLLIDYAIWGRKRRALNLKEWGTLLLPQIAVAGIVISIWNPFATGNSVGLLSATLSLKVWLMFISFCDISASQFGVGIFLLIAPLAALFLRDSWLLRASAALFIYVILVSLLSPQIMDEATVSADIRYLAPLIPLCIFIGVRLLLLVTRRAVWLAIPLALVAFGTNLFEGVTLRPFQFHSALVRYVGELMHPPLDPYKPTVEWIRQNVPARASIWVVPDEWIYPLMFHAPLPTYAWQLKSPPRDQLPKLDPVHFYGRLSPDYIVVFGPQINHLTEELQRASVNELYERAAIIDVYWRDAYRPELSARRFDQKMDFDRSSEAVYIFRRASATKTGQGIK